MSDTRIITQETNVIYQIILLVELDAPRILSQIKNYLNIGNNTFTQPNQSKLGIMFITIIEAALQTLIHVPNEIFPISMSEWKVKSTTGIMSFHVIIFGNCQIWKDKLKHHPVMNPQTILNLANLCCQS